MPFVAMPKESREKINRAGQVLAQPLAEQIPSEWAWAIDLAERWRACHAYPINTFNSTLRDKTEGFGGDPIVAQRLKRMSTIIDKLKRFDKMELSRMQDIGGVRAILANPSDVRRLADSYINGRLQHELKPAKDYIAIPRDDDGYRSLHLIYKYKNKKNPSYDGLLIEMQIRTKLQHIWATAVETVGTVLRQPLKSRLGSKQWIDFFAITSSAFAYQEGTPCVPRFSHLSEAETFEAVSKAESDLHALDTISGITAVVEHIAKTEKGSSYHLLVLNPDKKTVSVRGYNRESFASAESDYSDAEKRVAAGEVIEPVLVSAGSLDRLRRAYPNFFLDIRDFELAVRHIVQK